MNLDYSFLDINKKCFVYIVECSDGSLYTGYTTDLANRMKQHKSKKGAKYTKMKGFKQLIYFERHVDKSTAMKREHQIKKSGTNYKWDLIWGFNDYLKSLL